MGDNRKSHQTDDKSRPKKQTRAKPKRHNRTRKSLEFSGDEVPTEGAVDEELVLGARKALQERIKRLLLKHRRLTVVAELLGMDYWALARRTRKGGSLYSWWLPVKRKQQRERKAAHMRRARARWRREADLLRAHEVLTSKPTGSWTPSDYALFTRLEWLDQDTAIKLQQAQSTGQDMYTLLLQSGIYQKLPRQSS